MSAGSGRLVLVGTPLGNREDLSPRARRLILEADLLFCEDTRSVVRLLGSEEDLPPRHSCFAANERARVPRLLECLAEGQTVVFVSEAGMPVWSDPGRELVEAAIAGGYTVDVVPGPTAAATALCHSGFSSKGARFVGFPPRDGVDRAEFLAAIVADTAPSIVYEAGNRTPAFLRDLAARVESPDTRKAIVARELTKLHQEVLRGTIAELEARVDESLRGEVTLVIEGRLEPLADPGQTAARAVLEVMLDRSLKPRPRAKRLAELTGLEANAIYTRLMDSSDD